MDLELTHLEEVEEIANDLHEGEHEDTGGDGGDAGVHVLIGALLFLLDKASELLQECVPLVHLIS